MRFDCSSDPEQRSRKRWSFTLALCWICGLVCGMLVYLGAGDSLAPLMRSTIGGTVSIVSLLYVTFLPFLISALAVSFSRSTLLLICFGKAVLFAFTALGLFMAFGYRVLARLILFSDLALLPLLYFLWLRLLKQKYSVSLWELAFFLALTVLIVCIDHRIISPIPALLIEF